jgi:glycosyltransferase involved in cell wall biosynthesis
LTDQFQIFVSRIQEPLNPNLIKIYWHQDLPEDPNAVEPLKNNGWKKFDMIVFNSSWQQTAFQRAFNIPYWKCITLCNAIEPFELTDKPDTSESVNLIYHTTPHRGLELLVPVFERLAEDDKNITLDVYSSFNMYGWGDRDQQYNALFDRCIVHPQINYHGYQKNEVIREALQKAHIYAYPSIWTESSCISLMEAMSARALCVHSNLGALWDTGGGLTRMYHFDEDVNIHANRFALILKDSIESVRSKNIETELSFVKSYADIRFNWSRREVEWTGMLQSLIAQKADNRLKNRDEDRFVYRTS